MLSASSISCSVGLRPLRRVKPQASIRGPAVMSNAPSVSSLQWAAREQLEGTLRDRDRLCLGESIDPRDLAVVAIDRQIRFNLIQHFQGVDGDLHGACKMRGKDGNKFSRHRTPRDVGQQRRVESRRRRWPRDPRSRGFRRAGSGAGAGSSASAVGGAGAGGVLVWHAKRIGMKGR